MKYNLVTHWHNPASFNALFAFPSTNYSVEKLQDKGMSLMGELDIDNPRLATIASYSPRYESGLIMTGMDNPEFSPHSSKNVDLANQIKEKIDSLNLPLFTQDLTGNLTKDVELYHIPGLYNWDASSIAILPSGTSMEDALEIYKKRFRTDAVSKDYISNFNEDFTNGPVAHIKNMPLHLMHSTDRHVADSGRADAIQTVKPSIIFPEDSYYNNFPFNLGR